MRAMNKILATFSILAGLLMAGNASATIYSFDLEGHNAALNPYPGPYANVSIDLSATTALVTFTGLPFSTPTYPNGQYLIANAVGLNLVDPTNVSVSNIMVTLSTWTKTPDTFSSGGSQQFDGLGTMNFSLNNSQNGFPGAVQSVSFTLTDTTANWLSLSDLLINDAIGSYAAAHVAVWDGNTVTKQTNVTTGFAATVPEPCTLFLLGGGALLGLAGYKRKRSNA